MNLWCSQAQALFLVERFPRILRDGIGAALLSIVALSWVTSASAQSVALKGNRSAASATLSLQAPAQQSLRLHIVFQLRNPDELHQLSSDLQNPASPRYHRWLTPKQFDAKFGRTPGEVREVTKWLSAQGFRILSSSNREIAATATVTQAEAAFATSIAASSDGVSFANTTEPQIPAQFADLIGSIEGLDNLRHWMPITRRRSEEHTSSKQSKSITAMHPARSRGASKAVVISPQNATPAFQSASFGPQDVWTFYDETPPLSGATNGSGGDCLGIIEDSDYLDTAVTTFDSTFGLPDTTITRVFSDTSSPGKNSDEGEALIDIEWGHAIAPGAPINVYIGNSDSNSVVVDPLTDSIVKAINDNACGAISFSYIFCGADASFYMTTLGNAFTQAAMQGQSFFAASGDWGAAGLNLSCERSNTTQFPSEASADPFVTSVGGTEFAPTYNSSGNQVGHSAESAWNDGSGSTGGGVSAVFSKPSYQDSVTPNDGQRDIPDVALGASSQTPGFW